MSTEQAIDPELVEQTKQQIRGLVNEIAQLARQDIGAEEFYGEFLNRVIAALAASAGVIWTLEEGVLKPAYQSNLRETRLGENEEELGRHNRLLEKVIRSGEPLMVPPHSGEAGEDQAGNPTAFLVLLAPVKVENETKGIVEVFQRPNADIRTQRGYLRFLLQMCELVSDFLRSRQLRQFTDRQTLWNQLESFTRAAHSSLEPTETAFMIVNEARRLIGCDRVSIAIRKGKKCYIEAVSGQDILDKRSNTVTLLGQLATAVVAAGEPVWYSGDTSNMAPQVEQAFEEYVDDSHAKSVAVLPLMRPRPALEAESEDAPPAAEALGALIVEQIEDSRTPDGMMQRVNVVCDHTSTALGNALEHNGLFLLPLWRTLGKARWVLAARTLPKTIAVAVASVAAIAALVLVPADFRLEGRGTLQPVSRGNVYAQIEGTVTRVRVKHGSKVAKGDVLAELHSTELLVKLAEVQGAELEAREQLASLGRRSLEMTNAKRSDPQKQGNSDDETRLKSEERQLERKIESLETQMALLKGKKEYLTVRSPIDGVVTTFDVEKLLETRTVQPGQELMQIANPDLDWELEVLMPEDQMGYVARAQKLQNKEELNVKYILGSKPGDRHDGHIQTDGVHLVAEVRGEEGNTVMIHVAIDKNDLGAEELKQGAGVVARVDCGRRALGFVWFHDLIEFVQSRILFKI